MFYLNIFLVTIFVGITNSEPTQIIVPCKKNDKDCIMSSAKIAFTKFAAGFPDLGVSTSDPLSLEEIVGDLSTLKYKFTNNTAIGLKNCEVSNVNLDLEKYKLNFELLCKNIVMDGHYTISGRLIILPVEGDGPYEIICKQYKFAVDADLKEVESSNGQKHIAVKKYKFTSNAQERVTYDFKNLFNGQKDLAETVLKFANENWKEVTDFVQEPVLSAIMKKLMSNLNKFLKLIPVGELFLS